MDNTVVDFINTSLNVILTLAIAAFLYTLYNRYTMYSPFKTTDELVSDEYSLKIKIPKATAPPPTDVTDYNHIRQRKVRRELKDGQQNIQISRKKIEDKHKKKLVERQQLLSTEAHKEFIISLDSITNKFVAELTNLKQRGVLVCDKDKIMDKIIEVDKVITHVENNVDRLDRGYQKVILLKEYKDKLSRC